jgi:hypothetical protein
LTRCGCRESWVSSSRRSSSGIGISGSMNTHWPASVYVRLATT